MESKGQNLVIENIWSYFAPLINRESKPVFDRYLSDSKIYEEFTKIYRLEEELDSISVSKGITALDFLESMSAIDKMANILRADTHNIIKLHNMFKEVAEDAGRLPNQKPYATKTQLEEFLSKFEITLHELMKLGKISGNQIKEAKAFYNIVASNKLLFCNTKKIKVEYYRVGRIPKRTLRLFLHALKFQLFKRGVTV